jgi:hypothetical protein
MRLLLSFGTESSFYAATSRQLEVLAANFPIATSQAQDAGVKVTLVTSSWWKALCWSRQELSQLPDAVSSNCLGSSLGLAPEFSDLVEIDSRGLDAEDPCHGRAKQRSDDQAVE